MEAPSYASLSASVQPEFQDTDSSRTMRRSVMDCLPKARPCAYGSCQMPVFAMRTAPFSYSLTTLSREPSASRLV